VTASLDTSRSVERKNTLQKDLDYAVNYVSSLTLVVLLVLRVIGVNRMFRPVLMLFVPTMMVMAVMMMPIVAVFMLVAVMSLAMMNISRRRRGGRSRRCLSGSALRF
jgi:hypothetical protein